MEKKETKGLPEEGNRGEDSTSKKSGAKTGRKSSYRGGRKGGNKHNFKKGDKFNDVSWYKKYPTLVEAAAKLGFNHIGGYSYDNVFSGQCSVPQTTKSVAPGAVLRLKYFTLPGISAGSTSGFATQIRKLYLAMKRKYRGLNTYQIADLAVTIFCISEFYRYIAKLERIYGICNYFNARNRTMPKIIPGALLFKYNDIANHLADFRTGINQLIIRAQTLCLPNGLDVVNRWFLLESNVFKDSEDPRANYIIFDSDLFYTYQATVANTGGSAVLSTIDGDWADIDATYEELLRVGTAMLDLLLNDDDITLQLGDIISYFTQENGNTDLLVLQPIPEDYTVVPVYNEDILHQVHNAVTVGSSFATIESSITITMGNYDSAGNIFSAYEPTNNAYTMITQDNSGAIPLFELSLGNKPASSGLYFDQSASGAKESLVWKAGNGILDTWKDVPTEDDVIEMTRLMPWIEQSSVFIGGNSFQTFNVKAAGTELVIDYSVYDTTFEDPGDEINFYTIVTTSTQSNEVAVCQLTQFDWHPRLYIMGTFSTAVGSSYAGYTLKNYQFGDLDNARVIETPVLRMLHDAVIMSEFEISSVKAFDEAR